jgi:hypothetical protein
MAVVVPEQIRSIDPWSENRFSDNYNLRHRLLTKGEDVVVHNDSFALSIIDSTTLRIGPGIAIKDDVAIHIYEYQDIDLYASTDGYGVDSDPPIHLSAVDYTTHVMLKYQYARSMPAPSASYRFIEDVATYFTSAMYMYLGYLTISNKTITEVHPEGIMVPFPGGTTYRRITINPYTGYSRINGGVVRPEVDGGGGPAGWYEEWSYY